MAIDPARLAAVARRAACIGAALVCASVALAAPEISPHQSTAPTVTPAPAVTVPAPGNAASARPEKPNKAPAIAAKPMWSELTPAQQQALSPLAAEWDKLDAPRKKKWLALSNKYSTLKPEEQARLQTRMREWAKLTPEQRHVARESYARAKKLNPNEKTAEWQQYQQLPEEQKKKLAAEAAAKKRVANLPPPSQNRNKVTPPSKSTLKHDAGKSTPAAEGHARSHQYPSQTAVQPASPPNAPPSAPQSPSQPMPSAPAKQ